MVKVVYLTWAETPRTYGIYRSQVIDIITKIRDSSDDVSVELLAGLPVIHSGLVREKLKYKKEIATIKELLGKSDISFKTLPIFITQNFVYPSRFTFPLIFLGAERALYKELIIRQPDIVHCRSMLAAYIASKVKKKHRLKYKIVYDVRSLWPENIERRKPNAKNYAYFKQIEKSLVRYVDSVVSVNPEMASHYKEIGSKQTLVNYLAANVDQKPFEKLESQSNHSLKVLFLGAIRAKTIQDPILLFTIFETIHKLFNEATLTIITTSSHKKLRELALGYFGKELPITFIAVKDRAKLQRMLTEFDLAIHAYRKPTTEIYRLFASTGFATKSSEYLAAGLPIIVSKYPKSIGNLLATNNIGLVYDEDKQDGGLSVNSIKALLNEETKRIAQKVALDNFDYNVVAKKFVSHYISLLK